MAKFAATRTRNTGPLATTDETTTTHEGADAHRLGPVGELFTRIVTDFVEDTFYEPGSERLQRLQALTHLATVADRAAVSNMAAWARQNGNMRSAPIVVACEYAAVGGPNARYVVDSVAQRADEPAELLGYWLSVHGRRIPAAVKRGIADAARRLYTQRSMLRYDSARSRVRPADVLALCHPKPIDDEQAALFRWLGDRRHNRPDPRADGLYFITNAQALDEVPVAGRRAVPTDTLRKAAFSWERYAGWIQGEMDAKAWETVIPLMGYMALLRNLRNFEQANISPTARQHVIEQLTDPDQIKRSRQLPFRFWTAYKNTAGLAYSAALEQALDTLVQANVPRFTGPTLVLVDTSGSMQRRMSARSTASPAEQAALFGAVLGVADPAATDVVAFATNSADVSLGKVSVLRDMDNITRVGHAVGHSTNLVSAVHRHYDPGRHRRIIVLTDMQIHPSTVRLPDTPVYLWDLQGYGRVPMQTHGRHHVLAGISDRAFDMINLLEAGQSGRWPWE